jgi:hypothetical protein
MEYNKIEEILNRYMEGESTLEEEALLKEYFSQPHLQERHREMKDLFLYLNISQKESAPPFDVTTELNTLIEKEWKSETRGRFKRILAWAGSAAAVLVLTFGIFRYTNKPEYVIKDTYKDPKLAYAETKRALMLVSRTMNHSTANLKYLSKVDESFGQMKKISKIDKVVNSVKNQ